MICQNNIKIARDIKDMFKKALKSAFQLHFLELLLIFSVQHIFQLKFISLVYNDNVLSYYRVGW